MSNLNDVPIPLKLGVKGHFKLSVSKDGITPIREIEFDNLITNTGLDYILSGVGTFNSVCCVGTGNATPTFADTRLQTQIAALGSTDQSDASGGAPNYTVISQRVFAFGQGAAAGNLTEVGVGAALANPVVTNSRALIVDGSGNPTTLTVLSDEFLTVTYTLTLVPNLADTISTVGGYTLTTRVAIINSVGGTAGFWRAGALTGLSSCFMFTGTIGAVTGSNAGTGTVSSTATSNAYTNGTFFRDYTITWAPSVGALTCQSFKIVFSSGTFQIRVSPTINKTASQLVTLVFRVTVVRV